MTLKNKKVAILGVGVEGVALAVFLYDKVGELFLLDKQTPAELSKGDYIKELDAILTKDNVFYKFGNDYLSKLDSFDIIFRSPGISILNQNLVAAKERGVTISSQIKLFFELCPCKIIGVTGTKGKGTTSSLIYDILTASLKNTDLSVYIAGNIGYPAITLIPKLKKDDIVILELSSFQLMDLEKSPEIAVITNLTIDHLDYHKDEDEYRNSKLNIIKYQTEEDYSVINKKAADQFGLRNKTKSQIKYFSREDIGDVVVKRVDNEFAVVLSSLDEIICKEKEVKLLGVHNLENIAAAVLVSEILKIDHGTIKNVVKNFKGLPHRLEFIAEIKGVQYINDSFATNPEPTLAAIEAISAKKVLILGGSSKGADFSLLADKITESNVSAAVLIGSEGKKIHEALEKAGFNGQTLSGGTTMDEIVQKAATVAEEGDTVILSPACASFGLFDNYKDRGEKFRIAVKNLSKK